MPSKVFTIPTLGRKIPFRESLYRVFVIQKIRALSSQHIVWATQAMEFATHASRRRWQGSLSLVSVERLSVRPTKSMQPLFLVPTITLRSLAEPANKLYTV